MERFKKHITESQDAYNKAYDNYRADLDMIQNAGGSRTAHGPRGEGTVRSLYEVTVIEKYPYTYRTTIAFTHNLYTRINSEIEVSVGYVKYEGTRASTLRVITDSKKVKTIKAGLAWIKRETSALKKK